MRMEAEYLCHQNRWEGISSYIAQTKFILILKNTV